MSDQLIKTIILLKIKIIGICCFTGTIILFLRVKDQFSGSRCKFLSPKTDLFFVPPFGTTVVFAPVKTIVMSDNKMNIGGADRRRISLTEDYELRYWANKFGVSRDELKEVVRQVGDNPQAVEDYLKAGNK